MLLQRGRSHFSLLLLCGCGFLLFLLLLGDAFFRLVLSAHGQRLDAILRIRSHPALARTLPHLPAAVIASHGRVGLTILNERYADVSLVAARRPSPHGLEHLLVRLHGVTLVRR